jgi:hypothetical protein
MEFGRALYQMSWWVARNCFLFFCDCFWQKPGILTISQNCWAKNTIKEVKNGHVVTNISGAIWLGFINGMLLLD